VEQLKTGDGRPFPGHLKAQISRELDRLELLPIDQGCRDRAVCSWLGSNPHRPRPAADFAGPEKRRAGVCGGPVGALRYLTTDDGSPLMRARRRRASGGERSIASKASRNRAIRDCKRR